MKISTRFHIYEINISIRGNAHILLLYAFYVLDFICRTNMVSTICFCILAIANKAADLQKHSSVSLHVDQVEDRLKGTRARCTLNSFLNTNKIDNKANLT